MTKVRKLAGFAVLSALIFCCAPEWSGAQDEGPGMRQIAPAKPIEFKDGKLRLRGRVDGWPLVDVIRLYARKHDRVVAYDGKLNRHRFDIVAPLEGKEVGIEGALRIALARVELALVNRGEFDQIVRADEAPAHSVLVTQEQLEKRHPLEHVRLVYRFDYVNAHLARAFLHRLTTRQSGQVYALFQPGDGASERTLSSIVICDEAGNLRDIVKLLKALDSPAAEDEGERDSTDKPDEDPKQPIGDLLILKGEMIEIPANDLIRLCSEYYKYVIVHDWRSLTGRTISLKAPKGGFEIAPEDVTELLRHALGLSDLALVRRGEFYEVVSASDAPRYSPTVNPAELKERPALENVRFVYRLKHANAIQMRALLQNLTSRQAGLILPLHQPARQPDDIAIDALIICDEAANVRDLLKMIKLLDKPRKSVKPGDD